MRLVLSATMVALAVSAGTVSAGTGEDLSSWGRPVPLGQLAAQRGGAEAPPTLNYNDFNAKLFDNSAKANVTGTNTITDGAFSGATGLPIVIQNSGNNVIIQNGTILNLTVK